MSLFNAFLRTISDLVNPIDLDLKALSRLNPDRFQIENVRSLLGVSAPAAIRICETAVRQGVFLRKFDVLCPDGSIAASGADPEQLPKVVSCWHEDDDGHLAEEALPTSQLRTVVSYRLADR